jgi:hypothetical protein
MRRLTFAAAVVAAVAAMVEAVALAAAGLCACIAGGS